MVRQGGKQMHYLDLGQVKKLSVRKQGEADFQPINPVIVEISPALCSFEREARQEFQVGEELDLLFDMQDCSLSARASIGWVVKCEHLDEGYEQKVWFSYGAEFDRELDADFFQRIAGDPKKSRPLGADCIIAS